ncbi:MAG: hypothetical protein HQL37_16580 [Alphaproteobacteria bacterium]|nr:hypothetical protein [Alphaproteobacteria bacterium]
MHNLLDSDALVLTRAMLTDSTTGTMVFRTTEAGWRVRLGADPVVTRLGTDQTNRSLIIDGQMVLKLFRQPVPGPHPEIELGRYLGRFLHTPPLLGEAWCGEAAVAVLHGYLPNQGDAWTVTLARMNQSRYQIMAHTLGVRVAELHRALVAPTSDPAFVPEPVTAADLLAWRDRVFATAETARQALLALGGGGEVLLARWPEVSATIQALVPDRITAVKTRLHGDLHLGQFVVADEDFYVLDFEGEPTRPLSQRRAKDTPLRDVAGMLRSFNYAAETAGGAGAWETMAAAAFLEGYRATEDAAWPAEPEAARRLLALLVLEKALYEIAYEAVHRPEWVRVPVAGVVRILDDGTNEQYRRI